MTGLNHALTGATVAALINEPAIALPAALLSHFVVDMIPHWDYKVPGGLAGRKKIMAFDLALSLGLLLILSLVVDATPWVIVAGGLLGILPDTMWLRFFMTGKADPSNGNKNPMHLLRRFHLGIQWSETPAGIYVEAAWFVLVLCIIFGIYRQG
jgi:hypothetical protein